MTARLLAFFSLLATIWVIERVAAAGSSTIPKWLEFAQRDPPVAISAGIAEWSAIAPGFEIGELAGTAEGFEVDRILLVRVDPMKFRFVVRHSAQGNKLLGTWMKELEAPFVINGSDFDPDGTPSTPIIAG
jgi:hypothetical protein